MSDLEAQDECPGTPYQKLFTPPDLQTNSEREKDSPTLGIELHEIGCSHCTTAVHEQKLRTKRQKGRNALWCGLAITTLFMSVEFAGGLYAGSLALLTDAAHMLTDVASLVVSLTAYFVANRRPTESFSFGYHRVEILGALLSAMMIWALSGILIYESVERIRSGGERVDGVVVTAVAGFGLAANILMVCWRGRRRFSLD
eukprot:gnl/Spiro4/3487_TR1708_c0_g1_i4.p1 gnl/Spiro4/3487_TR1708_c0_g1~~gnl/Spiro4/3487_TR1708_c0_g1_i4.p1  ORF type:complete len:210 (-),score=10.53 gnl/Spiro4/3487_TR1708_c0_g1_i4:608-1207(-)